MQIAWYYSRNLFSCQYCRVIPYFYVAAHRHTLTIIVVKVWRFFLADLRRKEVNMKNAIRRIKMMRYNAGKRRSSVDPIIVYRAKIEQEIYERVLAILNQEVNKDLHLNEIVQAA